MGTDKVIVAGTIDVFVGASFESVAFHPCARITVVTFGWFPGTILRFITHVLVCTWIAIVACSSKGNWDVDASLLVETTVQGTGFSV